MALKVAKWLNSISREWLVKESRPSPHNQKNYFSFGGCMCVRPPEMAKNYKTVLKGAKMAELNISGKNIRTMLHNPSIKKSPNKLKSHSLPSHSREKETGWPAWRN